MAGQAAIKVSHKVTTQKASQQQLAFEHPFALPISASGLYNIDHSLQQHQPLDHLGGVSPPI